MSRNDQNLRGSGGTGTPHLKDFFRRNNKPRRRIIAGQPVRKIGLAGDVHLDLLPVRVHDPHGRADRQVVDHLDPHLVGRVRQ